MWVGGRWVEECVGKWSQAGSTLVGELVVGRFNKTLQMLHASHLKNIIFKNL